MPKHRLTDKEKLQFIQEHWDVVPERRRARLAERTIAAQYTSVCKYVKRDAWNKEKGDDTYPIYTLKRVLKYKKLTKQDLVLMMHLLCDKLANDISDK